MPDEIQTLPVTVVENDDKTIAPLTTIKTEANFSQLPFFALSNKDASKRIELSYRILVERNGQKLDTLWEVTANAKYGYPTPFDRKVHKAIEYLITEQGTPVQNPIRFTTYRILKLLNLSADSGANIRKVKEAFERIVMTGVKSEGTFYSKGEKEYITKVFHLYDMVIFKGKKLPDGETAETNYLFLNEWYLKSLNAHFVRPLDFQYLKSLNSDVAGRLYELLGLKFFGVLSNQRAYWRVGYGELCLLLPITQQRKYSDAQRYIRPAHDELVKTGFLAKAEWEREKKALWFVRYYPGERARVEFGPTQQELEGAEQLNLPIAEKPKPPRSRHGSRRDRGLKAKFEAHTEAKTAPTAQEQTLIEKLAQYGIAANQVTGPAELLRDYGAEEVEKRILALDHMTKQGKPPLSPQLIIDSLKKGWIPNAYHEAAEEAARIEAKKEAEAALTEAYRREAEAVKAQVEEWGSLAPEKRINFKRLDLWEITFRRRYGRNPDPEEKQTKITQMIADLRTPEEELTFRWQDLKADFDRKAREQGITFKP